MPRPNPYTSATGEPLSVSTYVLRFPQYVMWCSWGFLRSWLETRQLSWLWQGLPALLLATLLGLLLLNSGQPASSETISSYLDQAKQATLADDLDRADFYFRKLGTLAPDDENVVYEHAMLDARRAEYVQAALKLQRLLDDETPAKNTRVHLWLAEQILEGKLQVEDPDAAIRHHLNEVLAHDSDNLYAHHAYAQLCLSRNDVPNAIKHLEPVAPASPRIQLLLAALYRTTEDDTRMRLLARRALEYYATQVNLQSKELEDWHKLAEAHVLLEDYAAAVGVLKEAHPRFEEASTRRMLAEVYLMWSDHTAKVSPENLAERMRLLDEAFKLAPDAPKVLQRLQDIAMAEGPAAEEANRQLQQALAEGVAPGVIHFLFGTSAAMKGDDEAAIRHFNQSIQKNPRTAVALNNLAFVMARAQDPDLPRALELADQAVRYAPLVASFRDTRGQILVRMQRYTQGISDLEFALPQIKDPASRRKIHLALEEAYRQLGDATMAQIHQRKASELDGPKPATAPEQ